MNHAAIVTQRLILRQWQEPDRLPFAAMNTDPEVMQYFPKVLSRFESDQWVDKIESLINTRGWGLWALERRDTHQFIGFTGLHIPEVELPCSPCTEIGWRLHRLHWGNGFVTEAANAALRFGFEDLHLEEIVSFTAVANHKSRAVMQRLNMSNTERDFPHPAVPDDSPLKQHVLYSITRQTWRPQEISK